MQIISNITDLKIGMKFLIIISLVLLWELAVGFAIASSQITLMIISLLPFLILLVPYPLYIFIILILSFLLEGKYLFGLPGIGIKTFHVILFFTFISYLIVRVTNNEKIFQARSLNLPLILILGWVFASFVWSPSITNGLSEFVRIFVGILTFILAANICNSKKDCEIVINILMMIGVFLAIAYLISIHFKIGQIESTGETVRSYALGGPNVVGGLLVFVFMLMLGKFTSTKRASLKVAMIPALSFMILGIFSVYSRGAILGFITGTILFTFLYLRQKEKTIKMFLLFVTPAILICLIFLFGELIMEFISQIAIIRKFLRTDVIAMLTKIKGRSAFWVEGFRMLGTNPISYIIGGGVGSYKTMALSTPEIFYYISYVGGKRTESYFIHAHSLFLSILFNFGIIGLILFGYFYIIIIKRVIKAFSVCSDPKNKMILIGFLAGLTGLYTHAFVEFGISEKTVFFLLGMAFMFSNTMYPEQSD